MNPIATTLRAAFQNSTALAPATLMCAALLPLGARSLAAQTVTTVISSGTTQSRYDLVILGDGYQASEQNKFDQDVQTFLTGLFQKSPFNVFSDYYNVHTVFRASQESGADKPDENPPTFVNTAYDASYNIGGTARCLYIQNTSQALADAALAPATEGRVLVMVNDTRYGGCASTFAVSYTGSSMTEVQAHELGHSVGALADEYEYAGQTYTGPEPTSVNVTTSPVGQKWAAWHGVNGISAFEGARYNEFGLWRPRINCLMRSLNQVLCRVCQENLVKVTNSFADVITQTTPPTTAAVTVSVPATQQFSFQHFVPAVNSPSVEWLIDGTVQANATGTSFSLDSTQIALGSHTVEARITDNSDRVRTDPNNVMRETRTWQVQISDPNAAQLRMPDMTTSLTLATPGAQASYTPTIVNDGPANAGPFVVELFLSTQNTWTVQDTLLARYEVTGLAANQQVSPTIQTQLPWSLPLQVGFVHAVVDRADTVLESDENDNSIARVVIGTAGPCTTGLEFQDQEVMPFSGSISIAAGGTLHPTVVAPCADPAATSYLIAWGGSGTTPGITLSPGVTLPLNFDPLTQIGLDGLNGPVFGSFLGVLNAAGVGQAQFSLPAGASVAAGTTHFAAVLLGATTLFEAVSPPVELTLLP
ncbi:MAG: M64 family metallopeptidase [Planctomycetota bacterium]